MVIGIDIGGTKITGIVFDSKKIVDVLTIVTPKTLVEFQKNLLKLVDFLSANRKISAIGVGMAGVVDMDKKIAKHSPNIKYINNFDFKKLFGKNMKLFVGNDAKCFTLAESKFGWGKGHDIIVGVILGTGVGSGFIYKGNVYTGGHFGAGEVGMMLYDGKQTFESLFQKARNSHNDRALSQIVGTLLGNLCRVLDPQIVVLGGGVATDKKRNFVYGANKIAAKILSSYKIKPVIKVSKLKNAGALGAALLAL
jgi:predicted NBD/HSP70 family sugar kinase